VNEAIVSIAKQFQNAKNGGKQFEGFLIGEVVAELPEIKVQIDPAIILDKTMLIFSAHVLHDYEREFEIFEGEEIIINNSIPNMFTAKGKIKWTDKMKNGDKLILVPSSNDNMYIVIDKAVSLT